MILVTGGTGFIGGHLLEKLVALGEPVRCLVRSQSAHKRLPAGVESVAGDLATGAGLPEALSGVDCVIHLAGVTKALRREEYRAGNARATETLARALPGPVRFVHVSSLAAAGPSPDGCPLDEDAEPHPVSIYGESKLEAERIVRSLVPDAVIVRPPVVYGPRDTDVFQLLRSLSKGMALEIAGPERWFSAIYAGDLADGLISAARAGVGGRTYFLAHPKPVTWGNLRDAALAIMGRTARVVRIPFRAARFVGYCAEMFARVSGRPGILTREKVSEAQCRYWTCDTRRAASELSFEAGASLEVGLARTLAWYKEAGWLNY